MSTLNVTPVEPGDVLTAVAGMGVLPQLVTQSAAGQVSQDQIGAGAVRAEHMVNTTPRSSDMATSVGGAVFGLAAWTDVVSLVPVAPVNVHGPGDEIEATFCGLVTAVNPDILSATDLYRFRILVTFTDATTLVLGPSEATFSMTAVNMSTAENSTALWDPIWNQRFRVTGSNVRNPVVAGKTVATVAGQVFVVNGAPKTVTVGTNAQIVLTRRAA